MKTLVVITLLYKNKEGNRFLFSRDFLIDNAEDIEKCIEGMKNEYSVIGLEYEQGIINKPKNIHTHLISK